MTLRLGTQSTFRFFTANLKQTITYIQAFLHIDHDNFFLTHNSFLISNEHDFSRFCLAYPQGIVDIKVRMRGGMDCEKPRATQPAITAFFTDSDSQLPTTWFMIFDNQTFEQSSEEKFRSLLRVLPTNILSQTAKVIQTCHEPGTAQPYEKLKSAILTLGQEPKAEVFAKYFKTQTLGTQKPSVFLAKVLDDLKALGLTFEPTDAVLCRVFLSTLPVNMSSILASTNITDVTALAVIADRIAEFLPTTGTPHNITAIVQPPPALPSTSTATDATEKLVAAIETLTTAMRKDQFTGRKRTNSAARDRRRPSPSPLSLICFYHAKYGANAKYCNPGCQFPNPVVGISYKDVCIFHARFGKSARNCREGCKHFLLNNNTSKN